MNKALPALAVAAGSLLWASTLSAQTAPAVAGPADAPPPAAVAQLQPPAGSVVLLRANAQGFQVYSCAAKPAGGFGWVLKAPDAILSDQAGWPLAKHYAGPTWQAEDGSKVVGEVMARAELPAAPATHRPGAPGAAETSQPAPRSIPWLLLKAKSHEGAGLFADVTYIQRLDTVGGEILGLDKPASAASDGRVYSRRPQACDVQNVGRELWVPYQAVYVFYKAA
jgi:hypothetical protein